MISSLAVSSEAFYGPPGGEPRGLDWNNRKAEEEFMGKPRRRRKVGSKKRRERRNRRKR